MGKFVWPEHIQFDDTEQDIKEARKVWLEAREIEQSCGVKGEFLQFMQAYALQVELRRNSEASSSSQSA
jgi:hypothetical protein